MHRLLVRDLRFPSGMCLELGTVRNLQIRIDRSESFRISHDFDLIFHRRIRNQRIQCILNQTGIGTADIVV